MMPSSQSKAISFGLVHIPIRLYRTTRDTSISFNQLCKETHQRVRYRKFCPGCSRELKPDEIIKGYQVEKDKYVVLSDDELEALKSDSDQQIHILHFVSPDEIDELYTEKYFYSVPEPHAEKAYELLRKSMQKLNAAAVAKTVMGTKETLLALYPREEDILLCTLFFQDELVQPPQTFAHPRLSKAENEMAQQLIRSMTKPFAPERYHDEYQARLRDAIEQKIRGQQITQVKRSSAHTSSLDLMEALQRSVTAAQTSVKKRRVRH